MKIRIKRTIQDEEDKDNKVRKSKISVMVRTIIIEKEDKVKGKRKIYNENKEHESMKSSNLLYSTWFILTLFHYKICNKRLVCICHLLIQTISCSKTVKYFFLLY
jgi:hypothetical protein